MPAIRLCTLIKDLAYGGIIKSLLMQILKTCQSHCTLTTAIQKVKVHPGYLQQRTTLRRSRSVGLFQQSYKNPVSIMSMVSFVFSAHVKIRRRCNLCMSVASSERIIVARFARKLF